MVYELWFSESENSYSYIPRDSHYDSTIKSIEGISTDYKLIWEFKAKSHFQAMQAYYDHLGWGTYKPDQEWEDIIFD